MQYNKQLQTKTDIFFNVHGSVHRKNIRIYKKEFFLNLCTGMSLTETDDTRCCINTIWPPEDEQDIARNMYI